MKKVLSALAATSLAMMVIGGGAVTQSVNWSSTQGNNAVASVNWSGVEPSSVNWSSIQTNRAVASVNWSGATPASSVNWS